ncbi:MAG: DUF4391 domain-containing protein [Luteolibacter sp.]
MFAWPPSTLVDRVIPKSKIVRNTSARGRLRKLLTEDVHEIRWLAKLSPETVKIPATKQVPEIAVFRIALKEDRLQSQILDLLDRAIAPPILFIVLRPDGAECHSAAYKRPSEADASQWVTTQRHTTTFQPPVSELPPLPAAIDLERLYAGLLAPILPLEPRSGESLREWTDRCASFDQLARQIESCTTSIHREKQFNRKVEMNRKLNELKTDLEKLKNP